MNSLKTWETPKGGTLTVIICTQKLRSEILLVLDIYYIKKLYPYVGVLKSTQVVLCKRDAYSSKFEYESGTLDTNSNYDFV